MSTSFFRRHPLPTSATCAASALILSAALGCAAGPAAASIHAHPARPGGFTTPYVYTGTEQTYTVPAGVTAPAITAVGAPGGTADGGGVAGAGSSFWATRATGTSMNEATTRTAGVQITPITRPPGRA